jgi:hypothetical protein
LKVAERIEPVWAETLSTIRVQHETLSSSADADFSSILSLADRFVLASLACGARPGSVVAQVLEDLQVPVTTVESTSQVHIERSDTVVVIAGLDLSEPEIAMLRSAWTAQAGSADVLGGVCATLLAAGLVIDSGALLLAVNASAPPAPLQRADAAIDVLVATANGHDWAAAAWPRSAFELAAFIAVAAVEYALTELTRCRRRQVHAC